MKQTLKQSAQLRIIAGRWRGRKLQVCDVDGLRPTGDRIRETLFNWLVLDIAGARCLDLFAGAGGLAFEALSRGVESAVLCEQNKVAVKQLRAHAQMLSASNAEIFQTDSVDWLRQGPQEADAYSLVFIDPPFALNLWQQVIDSLIEHDWLAGKAAIYIESGIDAVYQVPSNWCLHREKCTGAVRYCLFYKVD